MDDCNFFVHVLMPWSIFSSSTVLRNSEVCVEERKVEKKRAENDFSRISRIAVFWVRIVGENQAARIRI